MKKVTKKVNPMEGKPTKSDPLSKFDKKQAANKSSMPKKAMMPGVKMPIKSKKPC